MAVLRARHLTAPFSPAICERSTRCQRSTSRPERKEKKTMPTFEKVAYKGWPNCYRLANATIELVITADVGPRIIRLGFIDGDNMFANYPDLMGLTGGDEWRIYGGHRLWHAPEVKPRTYYPDNEPVKIEDHGAFVRTVQNTEPTTGIQKEIDITLADGASKVRMVHRLRNHGLWAVRLAPWALSVMNTGGTAIIPLPPRGSHEENLLPANSMTFWAYTDMADPRWTWGTKYVLLRQDPASAAPQKIGVMLPDGWAAYAAFNNLFLKTFTYQPGASYPDMGCNMETFTNADMLELETLGPLTTLEPGATVEYIENWNLFGNVPQPKNDADVDRHILPLAKSALG
jgi:hypothetical protein